jgi:hypothetical protein
MLRLAWQRESRLKSRNSSLSSTAPGVRRGPDDGRMTTGYSSHVRRHKRTTARGPSERRREGGVSRRASPPSAATFCALASCPTTTSKILLPRGACPRRRVGSASDPAQTMRSRRHPAACAGTPSWRSSRDPAVPSRPVGRRAGQEPRGVGVAEVVHAGFSSTTGRLTVRIRVIRLRSSARNSVSSLQRSPLSISVSIRSRISSVGSAV